MIKHINIIHRKHLMNIEKNFPFPYNLINFIKNSIMEIYVKIKNRKLGGIRTNSSNYQG